ncbi:6-hydroxymethylpterin diphosphokinase MptE-like protein [Methylomonas sp. HYX-M1]|uniref:6-hydroxymethylpterin diphosphokinase MptE-like protein n=1 Tax=Methylomonas sp. HYX-M1 TaxID=3139307 RepID=UPI00345C3E6A
MDENNWIEDQGLGPVSVNRFGERFFFNLNRHAFDRTGAEALFDAKFSETLFKEDSLNIIVGTDSGLLPRYVQNRGVPKGARYIFVEPDEVLPALQSHGMLADLDERIVCVDLVHWGDAIARFKITDYFYIEAVRSFNAVCAQDDFILKYAELSWHLTETLSQLHWQNSVELGMEAFITRQLDNVADNRRPAILLKNLFKHQTVAVLAGGPSLDEALPWVKANRRRLVVFAVSRIARQLLAAEIEPDFVFSVDPTELSFDISKEMLRFSDKVTFICSYHTVPSLLSQWLGNVFYLGERFPWSSPLNVANLGSAGPTVTNTALNVAYDMGARQIVLAGVDLCFTREGFTHAKGSDEQLAGPRFNLTSLQVETNAGFLAPTSCDFAQAIRSLSVQAKRLTGFGCRLINASGAAAKVEHVDFLPLSAIVLPDEPVDAPSMVAAGLSGVEDDDHYFRAAKQELKRAQFQIQAIAKLAENARRINDQMYDVSGVIVHYKDKQNLDRIEKKFKREYRQFSKLVKRFGIRRFIKLAKPFVDEEWSAEEAKRLGNVYYDAYLEGANKLAQLLDQSLRRIAVREAELVQVPDLRWLCEHYRQERSFGRIRRWCTPFVTQVLSAQDRQAAAELLSEFEQVIENKQTRHFARAKSYSNLATVKQRAALLFKHQKMAELQDLQSALNKHEQASSVEVYRWLITAYLAELQANADEALEAYQKIVDAGELLLEEALSRIAAIAIDKEDAATSDLALRCLSGLNPIYLPHYAEIRRLHDDVIGAIDAYNDYIRQFPDDTPVQIKLATLYMECRLYDGAELMLDYLLKNKPGLEVVGNLQRQLQALKQAG